MTMTKTQDTKPTSLPANNRQELAFGGFTSHRRRRQSLRRKVWTLTKKIEIQTISKSHDISTMMTGSESAFRRYFVWQKRSSYAQVMSKKWKVAPYGLKACGLLM